MIKLHVICKLTSVSNGKQKYCKNVQSLYFVKSNTYLSDEAVFNS
jgi:hypothetical protein